MRHSKVIVEGEFKMRFTGRENAKGSSFIDGQVADAVRVTGNVGDKTSHSLRPLVDNGDANPMGEPGPNGDTQGRRKRA